MPASQALAGTCGGDLPAPAAPSLDSQGRHGGSLQGGWPRVALLHPLAEEEQRRGAKVCVKGIPEAQQELQPLQKKGVPLGSGLLCPAHLLSTESSRVLWKRRNKIPSGCAGAVSGVPAWCGCKLCTSRLPVVTSGPARSLEDVQQVPVCPREQPGTEPSQGKVLLEAKPQEMRAGVGRASPGWCRSRFCQRQPQHSPCGAPRCGLCSSAFPSLCSSGSSRALGWSRGSPGPGLAPRGAGVSLAVSPSPCPHPPPPPPAPAALLGGWRRWSEVR